jgi:uncharacterized protein (DUF2267 family)
MSVSTVPPLESTVHVTNRWLAELAEELGWSDRQRVYHALVTVLHALRDHLTVAEAADLAAQLPVLVRGLYYEGWVPSRTPVKERSRELFLAHIASEFSDPEIYPESLVWAVLSVLQRHVTRGEISEVKSLLPAELRSLWPPPDRA